MVAFSWKSGVSGDWNTASNWTPAVVPNDPLADVTIDAPPTATSYIVTIGTGESQTVRSLTVNGVTNLAGTNISPYSAARLDINGTLNFAPGSPGDLRGSLQTYITMANGTIVNPGTIDGFIQGQGNVLMTGTNGFYITNWMQALSSYITVDTKSITELTGNTLFDGIFEAQGTNAAVLLGGSRQGLVVNIGTIEGPPLIPNGWTEVLYNGNTTNIMEWNGTTYVPLESTLTSIGSRGTLDVIGGRSYITPLPLTIAKQGMLYLQANIFQNGGININGGTVQGSGLIANSVTNNGTMGALGGKLFIGGSLTGTGTVTFDTDHKTGTTTAAGSVVEVHQVGVGQTFVMNGRDYLVLDSPNAFSGTINAKAGDTFLLAGITATSARLAGSTLYLENNGVAQSLLQLSGNYAGNTFAVTNSPGVTTVKIVGPAPAATGASASSSDSTTPIVLTDDQYVNVTPSSLNITASAPNSFIRTGSGNDLINLSGATGNNVVDAGGGSNFLIGSSGNDAFSIGAAGSFGDAVSTITGFQAGDSATIMGVNLNDFMQTLTDNAGAIGATGLGISFSAPGRAMTELVLAGYAGADMANGRLVMTSGEESGTPYVTIRAA
jgi:hypothetical protein